MREEREYLSLSSWKRGGDEGEEGRRRKVEKDVRHQRDRWRRRLSEVWFSQRSSSQSPVRQEHAWLYIQPSIRSVLIPFWDYDYATSRHHAAVDAVSQLHASRQPAVLTQSIAHACQQQIHKCRPCVTHVP